MRFFSRLCAILVLSSSSLLLAEEGEPLPSFESHFKIGVQRYGNDIDPDPGLAGLGGFFIGHRLSNRSMVGISYAAASYRLGTQEETVSSLLLLYRYAFRVDKKTQPHVDVGVGLADPILGYDTGTKGAFTFSTGTIWRVSPPWAIAFETRAVYWSQDDTFLFEGSPVVIVSNEFTLGLCRSF